MSITSARPEDAGPRQQLADLPRPEDGTGVFPMRRRHARRGHEEEVERQPLAGRDQHVDPAHAQDVANLVRVGDHRGRPHRHDQPRQLGRGQERALQVHVGVDQARQDDLPRGRDRPVRTPRSSDRHRRSSRRR